MTSTEIIARIRRRSIIRMCLQMGFYSYLAMRKHVRLFERMELEQ